MTVTRLSVPFDGSLTERVLALLGEVFGQDEALLEKPTLSGEENAHNRDIQYIAQENGELLGITHVTSPLARPDICAVSGVCTTPAARGKGVGRTLVERCMADFDADGGVAAFLGTGNPIAAKLYASVGFSFLPGSNVMARVRGGDYMGFSARYFSGTSGELAIVEGSPAMRYTLVPLALHRGVGLLLDCNAGLFDCAHVTQRMCASLYPRYLDVAARGGFFAGAVAPDGALCAVASVLPEPGGARMDCFAHPGAAHALPELVQWCEDRGARYALVSGEDVGKRRMLEALGYREAGRQAYSCGPLSVDCAVMRK